MLNKTESNEQAKCLHKKTMIQPSLYYEEGRMRHPVEYKKVVCCDCGMRVNKSRIDPEVWQRLKSCTSSAVEVIYKETE